MTKIYLPVICYNHTVLSHFMFSVMKLVYEGQRRGIAFSLDCIYFESLIARARNAAAANFLNQYDCDYMLFIDSDISFEPEDVFRLLKSDVDLISGLYPKKYISFHKVNLLSKKGELNHDYESLCTDFATEISYSTEEDNFLEMDYLPTGFLLISRTAIEKIIKQYPELKYKNDIDGYMSAGDNFYDLFKVGIRNGIYESEDWGFCSLWKSVGGKVLIHPEVNVKHIGWHEYEGNLLKYIIGTGK